MTLLATVRAPLQGLTLSYGELDKRANQLAHRLIALGVGPEVPVGVMMDRSLDLIVALLGVLKAGGAYVPMDPSYPPDRLALMMEDSEVRQDGCYGGPARFCGQPMPECLRSKQSHYCNVRRRPCSSARRRCMSGSLCQPMRASSW